MTKVTPQIEERFKQLKEPDQMVLEYIQDGVDDVRKINKATAKDFGQSKINHRFRKLEDKGFITLYRPPDDSYVTEIKDGQKKVYQEPKRAELTTLGQTYLEWAEQENVAARYADLSQGELIEMVRENRKMIETLKGSFELFRRQAQNEFED